MAYETYTTAMLVCGSIDQNAHDRVFTLFTREAGMLYATARSARRERSRQRYALQDYTHGRVSLVKGKRGWLIGSAEAVGNYYFDATDRAARGSVIKLARQLRRLIRGAVSDPELFDEVQMSFGQLSDTTGNRRVLELLVEFRLLVRLGYVDGALLPTGIADRSLLEAAQGLDDESVDLIRRLCAQGMAASQL